MNYKKLAWGIKFLCLVVVYSVACFELIWAADQEKGGAAESQAKQATEKKSQSEEVTVIALKPDEQAVFLPDVQGTKINAGKKTSNINLKEPPTITNNNYRQVLVKTPGLLVSEETTPLLSIGYRGLDPHRAQFTQVMKDGVPIHADMFGYPEAYYTPPLQSIEALEFIRGGAALMYGPQPGGALNYVTKNPPLDRKLVTHSENVFGSFDYFSTYDSAAGTVGPLGYYGYFHERQSEGFRDHNSDYQVISSGMKTVLNQTGHSRLTMTYDEYHEEHGEPGGLTAALLERDNTVTTRFFDRFRLERYYGTVKYEHEFSEDTQADLLIYGGHYRRYSKRQRGGGFGTLPTGANSATNDIEEQDFYNLGFEERLRHNYDLFGQTHTVSVGTHTFMSHSPREDQRGTTLAADSGTLRKKSDRDTWYFSMFLENIFRFGRLTITPGVRLEHIWQHLNEKLNLDKTTVPLSDEATFGFAPLFGGGIAYEIAKGIEAYTNISQSYRPKIFTQAVPTGTNQIVNEDLKEGTAWQYDVGLRGKPVDFLAWDVSYFILSFNDQIGTIANEVRNLGDSFHQGLEFYGEADFVKAFDYFNHSEYANKIGSLSEFFTLTLLNADYRNGPTEGRTPQYAPQFTVKFGTSYNRNDRIKLSFLTTLVDDHFADDAHTANRYIPYYSVWDLTGEIVLLKNVVKMFDFSIFGGVNNLFNENYTARIRSDGIDPAYPRNFYGGLKVSLGTPKQQVPSPLVGEG
ncbi:MAG: TonB-dependent receptor plug domain-containing protein [Candidatus Omnitrophica bacterium]|nr:TonB-dependent receptor plug domain-containing protein [Candidatus Omnitrophota bacterium]